MLNGEMTIAESFAETDRGLVRSENEDSLLLYIPESDAERQKGILAVVADGVGGGACGKIASSLAVSALRDDYYASADDSPMADLKRAMKAANREVWKKGQQDDSCRGMATTCTAFLLFGQEGYVAHAGDSRAYLLRDRALRQITEDHTLVSQLLADGMITQEEAIRHPQRHVIVRALGSHEEVEPDGYRVLLEDGDVVLLCSDGLHGLVSDAEMAYRLGDRHLDEAGRSLLALAKEKGGTDNITLILVRISSIKTNSGRVTRPYSPAAADSTTPRRVTGMAFAIALLIALLIVGSVYYWAVAR